MSKTKDVADFLRNQVPAMDKEADEVHARMGTLRARHDDLVARVKAKLDDKDQDMGDLESIIATI